jgi:hypothetical protein
VDVTVVLLVLNYVVMVYQTDLRKALIVADLTVILALRVLMAK